MSSFAAKSSVFAAAPVAGMVSFMRLSVCRHPQTHSKPYPLGAQPGRQNARLLLVA